MAWRCGSGGHTLRDRQPARCVKVGGFYLLSPSLELLHSYIAHPMHLYPYSSIHLSLNHGEKSCMNLFTCLLENRSYHFYTYSSPHKVLPEGSAGKESTCSAGDTEDAGSILGAGRSPGGGSGKPHQYSWMKNLMDRGAWLQSNGLQRVGHN